MLDICASGNQVNRYHTRRRQTSAGNSGVPMKMMRKDKRSSLERVDELQAKTIKITHIARGKRGSMDEADCGDLGVVQSYGPACRLTIGPNLSVFERSQLSKLQNFSQKGFRQQCVQGTLIARAVVPQDYSLRTERKFGHSG
jgi:hypothetical protein